ncbi:GNAT family N-acetyltransferase [Leptolyngbya sp. 'hensonii']|uniref:GNAT family N-acetyltransferase n=1 Tax=Leptolyngbya sp. 'hensonii' TaxID=1922337 RepID=UPI00094FFE28|nr:GNAT family N-acetyltransferase [Leptolyngbya sp. 'hensonii']OLP19360.1 GNAT family N-acetyltransferase [Leptolyngbya sp. 'hensonii']
MFQTQFDLTPTHRPTAAPQMRIARPIDQKYVIATLVLAFSQDPIVRWMYPDAYQYLTHFPRFVQAFGGKAFDQGTAYSINTYAGTALWFSPGVELDAEPLFELVRHSVFEPEQADVFGLFEQMDHYHPHPPHWYLPLIGVEPTSQGQGYGSALLQHVLQYCDRDRIPAYLESSNPANIPLYQRHGFALLGTIQAGTSPTLFPMLRQPQ